MRKCVKAVAVIKSQEACNPLLKTFSVLLNPFFLLSGSCITGYTLFIFLFAKKFFLFFLVNITKCFKLAHYKEYTIGGYERFDFLQSKVKKEF